MPFMDIIKIILDFYFTFIIILFGLKFILKNKKVVSITFALFFLWILYLISLKLKLEISLQIYDIIVRYGLIGIIIILSPDIRVSLENVWREDKNSFLSQTKNTKDQIIEAVDYLSKNQIGALITIERHSSLEQYSQKAVMLNADVSKELLINIFTPLTPLHDGAVIIKGDKVVCAAAYYILSQAGSFDKTVGSRHRAGLGISEVSDSLTIIVSEQTGNISVTLEGFMIKLPSVDKLIDYLEDI